MQARAARSRGTAKWRAASTYALVTCSAATRDFPTVICGCHVHRCHRTSELSLSAPLAPPGQCSQQAAGRHKRHPHAQGRQVWAESGRVKRPEAHRCSCDFDLQPAAPRRPRGAVASITRRRQSGPNAPARSSFGPWLLKTTCGCTTTSTYCGALRQQRGPHQAASGLQAAPGPRDARSCSQSTDNTPCAHLPHTFHTPSTHPPHTFHTPSTHQAHTWRVTTSQHHEPPHRPPAQWPSTSTVHRGPATPAPAPRNPTPCQLWHSWRLAPATAAAFSGDEINLPTCLHALQAPAKAS
jgi:hypothetical protein